MPKSDFESRSTQVTPEPALEKRTRRQFAEHGVDGLSKSAPGPAAEVYHRLLERGRYLCSISTMHRLLKNRQESGDGRQPRPPQLTSFSWEELEAYAGQRQRRAHEVS